LEAESQCLGILATSPANADALHLLGVVIGELGQSDEAAATLKRAVKIAPRLVGAWLNLGVLNLGTNDTRAEECFRRVLALGESNISARGNLAELHRRNERYDDAEKELRTLLTRALK